MTAALVSSGQTLRGIRMYMVIGGSHQGKLEYAEQQSGLGREDFLDGASDTIVPDAIFHARGIYNFHLYVRKYLMDMTEKELDEFAGRLFEENPDLVLVSDEVGCGIVPVEMKERQYRETVGRVCTDLAKRAERVDRVVCGIGTTIKRAAAAR